MQKITLNEREREKKKSWRAAPANFCHRHCRVVVVVPVDVGRDWRAIDEHLPGVHTHTHTAHLGAVSLYVCLYIYLAEK